jgi:hypothetical protein
VSIKLERRPEGEAVEMTDLFELDGTMYQIPAKPKVNVSLQYLTVIRTQGPGVANGWLLETQLGPAGYAALIGYDDLSTAQLTEIIALVTKITMGVVERPTRPSPRGPKKSRG